VENRSLVSFLDLQSELLKFSVKRGSQPMDFGIALTVDKPTLLIE
jgi:hypothetical protein